MATKFESFRFHALYTSSPAGEFANKPARGLLTYPRASVTEGYMIYSHQLGKFPDAGWHVLLEYPDWIDEHLARIPAQLDSLVPDKSFDGVIVIDYSKIHVNFDWSEYESDSGYYYEDGFDELTACKMSKLYDPTDRDYREDFYNWHYCNDSTFSIDLIDQGDEILESFMRNRWNEVAKDFMLRTLEVCKAQRPKAKWTFFNYPTQIYLNSDLNGGGPGVFGYGRSDLILPSKENQSLNLGQDINNQLSWLYDAVDFLAPSLYLQRYTVSNSQTPDVSRYENSMVDDRQFLASYSRESARLANKHSLEFLPVIRFDYDNAGIEPHAGEPLNEINFNSILRTPAAEGAFGFLLWESLITQSQVDRINSQFRDSFSPITTDILDARGFSSSTGITIGSQRRTTLPGSDQGGGGGTSLLTVTDVFGSGDTAIAAGVDRRPARVYRMWEGPYLASEGDFSGSLASWWGVSGSVDNLVSRLDTDYALGYRRFMLYMPGGGTTGSFLSPNHWLTMSASKRVALGVDLKAWIAAHSDVSVSIYGGIRFTPDLNLLNQHTVSSDNFEVFDLRIPFHAEYFRRNYISWTEDIGLDSIFLHEASNSGFRSAFIATAFGQLIQDIKVGGGGLPLDRENRPDPDFIVETPWLLRYDDYLALQGNDGWQFDADNTEIGVFISPGMDVTQQDIDNIFAANLIPYALPGYYDNYLLGLAEDIANGSSESSTDGAGTIGFEIESPAFEDDPEGFGFVRYNSGFGGAVGDQFPVDYSSYQVVAVANSINGVFNFNSPLNKYTRVEVDITNSTFKNTGLPHWTVEDSFEWINSGMPSHLSQVYHSNIINFGISLEKSDPGLQGDCSPPYQGRYIVPCDQDWYDVFNSTVDYELEQDFGNRGLFLPYPNVAIYIASLGQVWVGGQGGILTIDTTTLTIDRLEIDPRRELFIKDIFVDAFGEKVYILDEGNLYVYDIVSGQITRDSGLGLPDVMNKVVVMFSQNLIIGAEDGIYARRSTQDEWQRVAETSGPVDALISPDAAIASANDEIWFSTEGFTWTLIGSISGRTVNELAKHRSQILVATDEGLYGDSGNFYAESTSIALINFLGDASESREVIVNDVISNFTTAVATFSDGRYLVWDDTGYVLVDVEEFSTIHKAIFVGTDIWAFSYDEFAIRGDDAIRRLVTGKRIAPNG
tara:strand:+ start:345438 stop:348965 length:3528 start_codon:yes stop_codon:yes gene_type:complete